MPNERFSAYQRALIGARGCLGYTMWADKLSDSEKASLDALKAHIHGMIRATGLTIYSGYGKIATVQSPGDHQEPNPGSQGGQNNG